MQSITQIDENNERPRIALISLFGLDLGLRYISSFLQHKGYSVSIIFFNKIRYSVGFLSNDYITAPLSPRDACPENDIRLLIKKLQSLNPSIIGMSVGSATVPVAIKITREIKKISKAVIVWGGPHAIAAPEECIRVADVVCMGEGEYPMFELAERLRRKEPLTHIRGLWVKLGSHSEKNELNDLITNLDALPFPDFIRRDNKCTIFEGETSGDVHIHSSGHMYMYPLMTSRGCKYACSYCSNSVFRERFKGKGPFLRRRSVSNVIEELKAVIRQRQVLGVRFWDDVFTYDEAWVDEFCERYSGEVGLPFFCYAHPHKEIKRILKKLRQAGLCWVDMGVQSGSERIVSTVYARKQNNQEILELAAYLNKLGIIAYYDFIVDNPYEKDSDHKKTIDLLLALPRYYRVNFFSLSWFPGTPLTLAALRDGMIEQKDLEQNSDQSLNNFHMVIDTSRTPKNTFWNCMRAMAVNSWVPAKVITILIRSRIFRRCPTIVFMIAKMYLLSKKRYSLIFKNGKISFQEMVLITTADKKKYVGRDAISRNFVLAGSRTLLERHSREYMLYPEREAGVTVCLRIKRSKQDSARIVLVMIVTEWPRGIARDGDILPGAAWRLDVIAQKEDDLFVRIVLKQDTLAYAWNDTVFYGEKIYGDETILSSERDVQITAREAESNRIIGQVITRVRG